MNNLLKYDIAVLGGGASGMAASISAARESSGRLKIAVIEKLPRVGKKILATGNGRCNLGNIDISQQYYHGDKNIYGEIINNFDINSIIDFFESMGLYIRKDSEGRLYPFSNNATSVLDALRLECKKNNISEICSFDIKNIIHERNQYCIISADGKKIYTKSVVIAMGGYAAPSMGTDGFGVRLSKQLGHKSTQPLPALCPIKTDISSTKGLKGIRVNGKATAILNNQRIKSELGEIQFSDGALSGICIFNLSRLASIHGEKLKISIDLMPELSYEEVLSMLIKIKKSRNNVSLENLYTGLFHKRIAQALLKIVCKTSFTETSSFITDKQLKDLALLIKDWQFNVTNTSGFNTAQVTSGGINSQCVKNNLESKIYEGLFFAGEVLDVDGDCGGYNLYWAWASGITSGKNAANKLKYEENL